MPAPTAAEKEELAVAYAALILHDDKLPITAENISTILTAANVKVQAYWPKLIAKILDGKPSSQIDDIILGGGSVGAAAPAGGAPAAAAPAAGGAPAAAAAPAKPESESEESEGDMGFGLFD